MVKEMSKNDEGEVRKFWKNLDEISREVDNWPDYKKVDGYVVREWTLKKKKEGEEKL